MLGYDLYIVSCSPEDSYFWVVMYYIFVFVMSIHIQVSNSIFIKTDTFIG